LEYKIFWARIQASVNSARLKFIWYVGWAVSSWRIIYLGWFPRYFSDFRCRVQPSKIPQYKQDGIAHITVRP